MVACGTIHHFPFTTPNGIVILNVIMNVVKKSILKAVQAVQAAQAVNPVEPVNAMIRYHRGDYNVNV